MAQRICFTFCSVHLLALAVSTYVAAIRIETILVSGGICSVTGLAAGVAARACGRTILALAAYLTPFIAVILFVLEALIMHLGPGRAALPFCIIFIINQVVATFVILIQLNLLIAPAGALAKQITIRTSLVAIFGFSVFFAIARLLLTIQHDLLMAIALGLLGLTFVGLCVTLFTVIVNRPAREGTS